MANMESVIGKHNANLSNVRSTRNVCHNVLCMMQILAATGTATHYYETCEKDFKKRYDNHKTSVRNKRARNCGNTSGK